MNAKPTVNIAGCSFEIGYAAAIMEAAYRDAGADFILTSAKDSIHSSGSLHYIGSAVDSRTRNLTQAQGDRILATLKTLLEPLGFDVVDERGKATGPHFHVEFDPKPGERFLTRVP